MKCIAVITTPPSSLIAPIYTLADFTCNGTGSALIWTVQGNSLTDPSNQDREISVITTNISVDVRSSVLTIRALPINNRTSVECTILDQNLVIDTKAATLTIKGKTLI